MAELEPHDPVARELLAAYRDRSGPTSEVQTRLRDAVLRDAELEPLSPLERSLLDAYRDRSGPSPAVQVRLRAAVLRAAGRPRWLVPAVVTALAAALLAALSLRDTAPQVADASHVAAPWEASPPQPSAAPARAPTPARRAEEAAPAPPELQERTRPARPRPAATPTPPVSPPATPPEPDLAAEARALAPAQRALGEGRPEDALTALAAYAARFPDGALREEHLGLRAVALCEAGRSREGRGEARVFLREHRASMLAGRVRTACELDAE